MTPGFCAHSQLHRKKMALGVCMTAGVRLWNWHPARKSRPALQARIHHQEGWPRFRLASATLAVRQLGGDLQALSDAVGKGAAFSLILPLCTPAANLRASDKAHGKANA